MNKKSSNPESSSSVQAIVLASVAWAILALLFFLLFSVPLPGQGRPGWYGTVTYILENGAFLGAGLLCFRNWRSSQIVSGRTVWLLIGLGMMSYFVGNLVLAQWELVWNQSPDLSPGDFFFILTYLLLGWGMFLAVIPRRLNLTPGQWAIIVAIGILGILCAVGLLSSPSEEVEDPGAPPALEQTVPTDPAGAPATAPDLTAPPVPAEDPALEDAATSAPGWVTSLADTLSPLSDIVTLLYIVGDILLVIMAAMLLLAFWGGRFSQSWRCIALAAFSFYIADIWFFYATSYIDDYQTGALPEVFWIFSGVLFGVGAALEFDLSNRSRQARRRRA